MFIEHIDNELLEEIQNAFYEEHDNAVANWDGIIIDLEHEDFEDIIRSEIFSDYLNTPLYMLQGLVYQHFPFLKEQDIIIDPFSECIISENEAWLEVIADIYDSDKKRLSKTEREQLDKLLKELTQLYQDLDIDTTLYFTHLTKEDVPEEYYEDDEEHNFIQIEF